MPGQSAGSKRVGRSALGIDGTAHPGEPLPGAHPRAGGHGWGQPWIDKLKIDQSFTRALGHDAAALPLVRGIIAIARDLGIVSLVEGVKTEEQAQIMRNEGCVEVQGYLFGRPMSAEAFAALAAQPPDQQALARVA